MQFLITKKAPQLSSWALYFDLLFLYNKYMKKKVVASATSFYLRAFSVGSAGGSLSFDVIFTIIARGVVACLLYFV